MEGIDFKKVKRSDWLEKVGIDLKGRDISDLDWNIGAQEFSPFYTNDNVVLSDFQGRESPGWEIGEYIKVQTEADANMLAVYALEGGAESLVFDCKSLAKVPDFSILLQNIYIDFISIHFEVDSFIRNRFVSEYSDYIISNQLDFSKLRGSVRSGESENDHPFTLFETHVSDGLSFYSGKDGVVREVASIYSRLQSAVLSTKNKKESSKLLLTVIIDDHFFINIAKLRAIRVLNDRLNSKNKSTHNIDLIIEAHPVIDRSLDINKRFIKAPLMALAATIAGVDRLILNYGVATDAQKSNNRTLRNNNHLLKMESFINKVEDPAKGSYFIESLTSWIIDSVLSKNSNS